MSKFDRNRIKDGWGKTLHKQTDRQTGRQTDRHYENNGHYHFGLVIKQHQSAYCSTRGCSVWFDGIVYVRQTSL